MRPSPADCQNADLLTRTGAALLVDEERLGQTVAGLLYEHPERLAEKRECAELSGRPQAARELVNQIFIISTPKQHQDAIG